MFNFDSMTLKYFFEENKDFILNSIVQKIQLPSRHEIILNVRNIKESKNKKLYININPKYPHICFVNDETLNMRNIEIPKVPPMFCMQLRKYFNGSKIKEFKLVEYERILELYFDYFDEIGSLTRMCLALEFMGKHSNIILYNAQNKIIIGSIHNISAQKSSVREVYGGINYIYPPIREKLNLLNTSYSTFFEIAKEKDVKKISENFYYFNQALLEKILIQKDNLEEIFEFLQMVQNLQNKKFMCDFWGGKDSINNSIDSYFSQIMFEEIIKNKKSNLKNFLKKDIKKLNAIANNKPDNIKAQKYKEIADFIMLNLYNIQQEQKELTVHNEKIELDENLSLNDNAQKYYALYKKTKIAYEYALSRYNEAKEKLEYYDTISFNIENSSNHKELDDIKDELIDLNIIQNEKKQKEISSLNKIEFGGYEIYIGKNNKQNDFLISKIATGEDLWFHGLNFPSSHIILKIPNNKKEPSKDVLEFCAKLTKENSKAKNGGKASIIMTKRKNLKKPPNTYPGYVTYKNEIEIVI